MARILRIKPYLGLGNRMLQYMLAEAIRNSVPGAFICGPGLPEWDIAAIPAPAEQAFALVLRGHIVPLTELIEFSRQLESVDIHLATLSARFCYYEGNRSRYQSMFPVSSLEPSAQDDELVINIRLAEIGSGAHPNYFPLPINWYRDLITNTGLKPVFMGQIGEDAYSMALRRAFPDARFIPSMGARADFDFIARAIHVALPISTFSWLAAWLSPTARTIHLPVAGLYHPAARPDHDLLPVGDPRYQFHICELHRWSGGEEQLAALTDAPLSLFEISATDLVERFPGIGTEGLSGRSWALRSGYSIGG